MSTSHPPEFDPDDVANLEQRLRESLVTQPWEAAVHSRVKAAVEREWQVSTEIARDRRRRARHQRAIGFAVAAGLATLKIVQSPGFYEKLTASTRSLCEGLVRRAQECSVPFSAASVGGMFGIYFRETPPTSYAEVMQCDKAAFNRFFHAMLAEGVYLAPSAYEAGFVSSAHGETEIERTLSAASKIFREIRAS